MSKVLIAIIAVMMFTAGAAAAAHYPPLAQYLGSSPTIITEVKTFPTTMTYEVTRTTTVFSNSTIITTSRQLVTTTLSQVISSTREVTETVTETIPTFFTFVTEVTKTVTKTVTAGGPTTTTPTQTTATTTAAQTPTLTVIPLAELVSPHEIYFSSGIENPGGVYVYDYQYDVLGRLFDASRRVSCFTFHPGIGEKVYYVDSNTRQIILHILGYGDLGVVFEHDTYIRCIRFGPDNMIYFSEATGAGGNGKIYKLVKNMPELYYEVRLEDVDGYWAGHFEFDNDGTLYLSSGNKVPASIYIVPKQSQVPIKIATFNFPVAGIRHVKGVTLMVGNSQVIVNKGLLIADWRSSLFLYDIESGALYRIYNNQNLDWLSDVSLRT